MVMKIVASSNIYGVDYNPETEDLVVHFKNGSAYKFAHVPADIADDLVSASSVGKYFNANIRNEYPFERM